MPMLPSRSSARHHIIAHQSSSCDCARCVCAQFCYALNYFVGRARNNSIAKAWEWGFRDIMEKHFWWICEGKPNQVSFLHQWAIGLNSVNSCNIIL